MRSTVFRATCTCAWRKAGATLAANPVVGLLAAFGAACAPGAAWWAGARLSAPFRDAAADPAFLRVLAVGVAASAAVAGLSVALLAPGPAALGPQVAAAPLSRAGFAAGAVVGPVCAAGAALALLLACFTLPLAGSDGLAIGLLALACASLGAALGEGVRLLAAHESEGALVLATPALVWLAAGVPGDMTPTLGPAGAIGHPWAFATLAVVAAAGLVLWLLACGIARGERAATRAARLRGLPARAGPAVAVATARRVLRHPELRLHGVTAVVLPLGAALVARLVFGVGGASATVFCVTVTLTAVALYPPAALGLTRGARWLLAAAPRSPAAIAGSAAVGGIAAAGALAAAAALSAAPLGRPEAPVYLELEAGAAFVLGCASLAGALVPWHPGRVLHQLASYATVLATVVAAWLAVGRLEEIAPAGAAYGIVAGNVVLLIGAGAAAAASR